MKILLATLFILISIIGYGQKNTLSSYQQNIYCDTLNLHIVKTIETVDKNGLTLDHTTRLLDSSCIMMSDIQYTKGRVSSISYHGHGDSSEFMIVLRYNKKGRPVSRWLQWQDSNNMLQMREQFFTKKGVLIPAKHERYMVKL